MNLINDWASANIFEPHTEEYVIKPSEKYTHPYKIQYDPDAKTPKYWVLPLSNFVYESRRRHDELKCHPLRIDRNGKIIKFYYEGGAGFIESLRDYEERKNDLLEGRASCRITAVMVGSISPKHIQSIDSTNLDTWFPFTFLPLLGFAVGNEIATPCIEIRDSNGKLVRRIIRQLEQPAPFSQGRIVIEEGVDLGHLISLLPIEHRGDTYLRVVLKHITRGGLACHDFEEKMSYIIRGFDCLGENYGLGTPQLTRYLNTVQKEDVKDALLIASKRIDLEAENAKKAGQLLQCSCLRRIAGRTVNAGNTDRNFGLEVVELLEKYGLHDACIVAKYYANSSNYRRDWISILNDYRGKPMHPGYFDFENKYDIEDVSIISRHLHDILIRVILKELKYYGYYRPAVFIPKGVTLSEYLPDMPEDIDWGFDADWVRINTPAIALGYITEEEKEMIEKRNDERVKSLMKRLSRNPHLRVRRVKTKIIIESTV